MVVIMSTQHTPGPWKIRKNDAYEEYWVQLEHYTVGPASIVFSNADADLIAAAPELLEALEDAAASLEDAGKHEAAKMARAAIAKATGEIK